jgi:hypothetical protein
MEKVKYAEVRAFFPASEWVRRLAEETTAFEIVNAVEKRSKRSKGKRLTHSSLKVLVSGTRNPVKLSR